MPRNHRTQAAALALALVVAAAVFVIAQQPSQGQGGAPPPQKPSDLGFTDTPMLPGLSYRVHDPARPHPRVVTPGSVAGAAPSDAMVLFDGKDLSHWTHRSEQGALTSPKWTVRDGYFEVTPRSGPLSTRESFGDIQLHLEWATPVEVTANSQGRGNSGVLLMGKYEVQVLDSYNNPSYADGQAGALYGQWPPLVNAARRPGEWQTYDIVFEAPRFNGQSLVSPAYTTVFWNGVVVHNRKEVRGETVYRAVAEYKPHAPELPLTLQDHGNPVRFRNIWIRRLGTYDQPAGK
jgi:Domain of Unknown Function (DUF1080)